MDTTTGMSPPPIEATRWTPSASAMTVTAISTASVGAMTNHTVSAANATSAPRFSAFLPGSTSGEDLNRAGELAPGDDRAGEGDRADEHADGHLGPVDAQQLGGNRPAPPWASTSR